MGGTDTIMVVHGITCVVMAMLVVGGLVCVIGWRALNQGIATIKMFFTT